MKKIQLVNSVKRLSKKEEIIRYLSQDNGYWLENDIWDFTKEFFYGEVIRNCDHFDFSNLKMIDLKNEVKYYFLFNFKNGLLSQEYLVYSGSVLKHFSAFVKATTLLNLDINRIVTRWKIYLINQGIKYDPMTSSRYFSFVSSVIKFIQGFYDDREETEKDIWEVNKIIGANIPASNRGMKLTLNFTTIPEYYREEVKRYFKTIITKRSASHCQHVLVRIDYFFNSFYARGYEDGFLKELNRQDIEDYLYQMGNDFKDKNPTYRSKFVSYIRTFLEYIQLAQYEKTPKKEVSFLIFQDDIPRRELHSEEVKKARFIPEPVIKEIDNNIMDLDRPQYIPVYILLRESGWRGTDILNLRYDNCLEKYWNNKEEKCCYYLCGEITKTGIANLKIPIRDQVAKTVENCIEKAKEQSTSKNNPKKYLFNIYTGRFKGNPYRKYNIFNSIKRLIRDKDIRDLSGNLYHFTPHKLRHTRAKEYTEQGLGISIIQQILGHRSLQMTVHYAKVTENKLYEKWKETEDLDLFKVDNETDQVKKELSSESDERLIRYEYVKKNLDGVKVPFGMCFKPSKMACKRQLEHCLICASFCTTVEDIPVYEAEINRVKKQIKLSENCSRKFWVEKNESYLKLLKNMLEKIKNEKIVHKNGKSREE